MLLALLLLAAGPLGTVRLYESGNAKVGSAAPSFGGWDLTQRKVLTLDGLRRVPFRCRHPDESGPCRPSDRR